MSKPVNVCGRKTERGGRNYIILYTASKLANVLKAFMSIISRLSS